MGWRCASNIWRWFNNQDYSRWRNIHSSSRTEQLPYQKKSFTGTGTGVPFVDKNGTTVTAKYTPTVTPVTLRQLILLHQQISKVKLKQVNQASRLVNPSKPMDDEYPVTLKMDQLLKLFQVKELHCFPSRRNRNLRTRKIIHRNPVQAQWNVLIRTVHHHATTHQP